MINTSLFELKSITKIYGATTALKDISINIQRGKITGLIGANGAGKSTLTRVISGVTIPDKGELISAGEKIQPGSYNPRIASRLGIRVVYQELSLCTNLTVYENIFIDQHDAFKGIRGWRIKTLKKTKNALDDIFPNHGIDPSQRLGDLSLSCQQMVEIVRAVSMKGLQLLILDEPTSSLGAIEAEQLMHYLRTLVKRNIAIIFISHLLGEIIHIADQIIVMRNGQKVWEGENKNISKSNLVEKMAGDDQKYLSTQILKKIPLSNKHDSHVFIKTRNLQISKLAGINANFFGGEFVGIAGLDGNGQREFLKSIFFSKEKSDGRVERAGRICYVTGDRKEEGLFPLWSIFNNMSIVEINKSSLFKKLDVRNLASKVIYWCNNLSIKAENIESPIVSLSGGNQQKVLVARVFLSKADIIILDDPTKGVDVNTKAQMQQLFREATANGKLIIWYSTEDEELEYCSRVLVFRYGQIVHELQKGEITKNRIIKASFAGENLLDRPDTKRQKRIKFQSPIIVPLIALLAVFTLSGIIQNSVFSNFGIDLLLSGSIPLVFIALAQMYIIGLSHIDLSIGAYVGLINVLCAVVLQKNLGLGLILIAVTSIIYGFVGVIIYFRKIPPVIATLGMSFVWTGIAYSIQEAPGGKAPEWLVNTFSLHLPIPESVIIVVLAGLIVLSFYRSQYGIALRGFGNNPMAMEHSGWSMLKAYTTVYVLASIFGIAGGLAITAFTGASDANSAISYTLVSIAAVIMGGGEFTGGVVSPLGTIISAITLSLLGALLGFMRLNPSFVTAVQGIMLLAILSLRLLRKVKL